MRTGSTDGSPIGQAVLRSTMHSSVLSSMYLNNVLDACNGDALVAKAAGNWASMQMVDEIYGHPDLHSPQFGTALQTVGGQER